MCVGVTESKVSQVWGRQWCFWKVCVNNRVTVNIGYVFKRTKVTIFLILPPNNTVSTRFLFLEFLLYPEEKYN